MYVNICIYSYFISCLPIDCLVYLFDNHMGDKIILV